MALNYLEILFLTTQPPSASKIKANKAVPYALIELAEPPPLDVVVVVVS